MKNKNVLPILCCIIGNVIWGFSFLLIDVALDYVAIEQLLAHRFTLSTLLMLTPLLIGKAKLSFKGKPLFALLSLMVMQLGYYFFETNGVQHTNSTFAGMMLAAVPIAAIVTGILFLKEYPSLRQGLFCLLPVGGIIVMTLSAGELGVLTTWGVIALFLCMCCSALYKTANRKAAENFTPYERTLLLMAISAVFFTIVHLSSTGWDLQSYVTPLANWSYTLPLLFLSIFCSIGANMLVNYAAGHMSIFTLASFGALSTLVSTFMGIVVNGDPANGLFLTGAAMILIGVQQVIRPDKKKS